MFGASFLERLGSQARRAPGGLIALILIVVVVGLVWALLVPPWQTPDKVQHFAYAQDLAENFKLPPGPGDVSPPQESYRPLRNRQTRESPTTR